jgi:hypothetical protein
MADTNSNKSMQFGVAKLLDFRIQYMH